MSVYLDAVFYPNFKHDPQILMQEGWHYHLENADDELIYKGVVYNEMRGRSLKRTLNYTVCLNQRYSQIPFINIFLVGCQLRFQA